MGVLTTGVPSAINFSNIAFGSTVGNFASTRQQSVQAALKEASAILPDLRDTRKQPVMDEAKRIAASLQNVLLGTLKDASLTASMMSSSNEGLKSKWRNTLFAAQFNGINLTTTRSEILGLIGESKEAADALRFAMLQGIAAINTAIEAQNWNKAGKIYKILGIARHNYASSLERTLANEPAIIENLRRGLGDLLMAQKFYILDSIYADIKNGGTKDVFSTDLPYFFSTSYNPGSVSSLEDSSDEFNRYYVPVFNQIEEKRLMMTHELQSIDPKLAGKDPAAVLKEMTDCPPDLMQSSAIRKLLLR